ncbi:hypothetical protein MRX96_031038 [Rhipicephalus microplus]
MMTTLHKRSIYERPRGDSLSPSSVAANDRLRARVAADRTSRRTEADSQRVGVTQIEHTNSRGTGAQSRNPRPRPPHGAVRVEIKRCRLPVAARCQVRRRQSARLSRARAEPEHSACRPPADRRRGEGKGLTSWGTPSPLPEKPRSAISGVGREGLREGRFYRRAPGDSQICVRRRYRGLSKTQASLVQDIKGERGTSRAGKRATRYFKSSDTLDDSEYL